MFSFLSRCDCRGGSVTSFLRKSISQAVVHNDQLHPFEKRLVPKARNKDKARRPNLSRKLRLEFEKHKNEKPLISCMRIEFNFYEGMKYGKFEPIPLASESWINRKSNGDYFTIYRDCSFSTEDLHFGNVPLKSPSGPRLIVNPSEEEEEVKENFTDFAELGIQRELCDALNKLGIERASDIQVAAIPVLMKRANTIVVGHPGCGKTLSYILPIIQMTLKKKQEEIRTKQPINSPSVLIITPSRELAEQIHNVLQRLVGELPITGWLFVGGYLPGKLATPKKGTVDIVVASLGAVNKAIAAGVFHLERMCHVILDEADQLLDAENCSTVRNILRKMKVQYGPPSDGQDSGAQVILVSATIPLSLQERLNSILAVNSLERVSTKYLHSVARSVPQSFLKVGKTNKGKVLLDLVERDFKKGNSILIFSNKAVTADWVSIQLNKCGIPCRNLTSKIPNRLRRNVMAEYKSGEFKVLSTTSMAARGIDTINANHVINFEFPLYMSDYIHRVGRVGRIGSPESCRVTNLVSHIREVQLVQKIEMAVRTYSELENVNANIPGILDHKHEDKFPK